MIKELRDGQIFRMCQRLKKIGVPFISVSLGYTDKDGKKYATFKAHTWAVEKAMHPFNGCNPAFTIWDSKVRGTALIAFQIY